MLYRQLNTIKPKTTKLTMIGSTFNEQLQIVEAKFKGDICLNEILGFVKNIGDNKFLPNICNIIIDATESYYSFGINELAKLAKNIEQNTSHFESIKGAVIHHNTEDTALSITLQRDFNYSKYQHRTFCTREAALEWLGVKVEVI